MIYPPIGELLEKIDTRYSLVIAAAKRARQLGAQSTEETPDVTDKAVVTAIGEIADGKVTVRKYN